MEKQLINFIIFIAICFVIYLLFRSMNNLSSIEGMTTDTSTSSSNSGIAGGAQSYAANIKSLVIKNQDVLLISKYRTDYENVILNLDDYVNTLMLQTALSINPNDPTTGLNQLVKLNETKSALNNVMKHIDRS
jgi:hypothetical protein